MGCTCKSIHELCDRHQKEWDARYDTNYRVEAEPTRKSLEDAVNEAIANGFKPVGGIIFKPIDGEALRAKGNLAWSRNWDGMYYQAMTKEVGDDG